MRKYLLHFNKNIKMSLLQLEQNNEKCLLVVDSNNVLKGTLTDGDIRRALLRGADINSKIKKYIKRKPYFIKVKNFNEFGENAQQKKIQSLIKKIKDNNIDIIPLIDKFNKVKDIIFVKDFNRFSFSKKKFENISTLIMAGGKGTRLKPFTNYFPKPLTPVEDKTATEYIINSFSNYGVKKFYISLNYKKNLVKSYLKENKIENLHFLEEKKVLGTAGALSMLKGKIKNDFFVINCDTIVSINLEKFYDYHKKNNYKISLVAATKNFQLSYGSCEINKNGQLKKILEKPKMNYLVNVGLYLFKPEIINLVAKNKFLEMDVLIKRVKQKGGKIGIFPISEDNWRDIGQP